MRLIALALCLTACGRWGFDDARRGDSLADAPTDTDPASCTGRQVFGVGGTPAAPGEYGAGEARIGCVYTITVDGAGGGRGNHDSPLSNGDGGNGGRVVFEFVPDRAGRLTVVIGGGGAALIGTYSLDDPSPGAGGGGSSQISFVPDGEPGITLAIAGGGGGGGWAEVGSDGGGGDGECGGNADEGSTGGCAGVTGTLHVGGDPGGSCPTLIGGQPPAPCGGPGGDGTYGPGGFGLGPGTGGDEIGNAGSGGGGGGYGGGAAGGGQGDPGLGGGGYLADVTTFIGGATGGAGNAARYADGLALVGGDGRISLELRAP